MKKLNYQSPVVLPISVEAADILTLSVGEGNENKANFSEFGEIGEV